MGAKLKWIDRTWTFDGPVEVFPDVLERLRGTPARIEELVRGVGVGVLRRREREGTWSIQENVGHLLDLDALHSGRIDDYLAGAATLRAADMSNRATNQAGHNERAIDEVLGDFRRERGTFVARLERLADGDFARTSEHPRLKVRMRLVDMCRFTADHDDYHLARMRELLRMFGG